MQNGGGGGSGEDKDRRIGFASLFVIIFSAVGSGPAGIEGIVGSCGLLIGLIAIVVFPFLWGLVQALISAELSIKYSDLNGAVGAWTNQIFGRTFARNAAAWVVLMQCSTAAFVSEVTVTYIQAYWPGAITEWGQQYALSLGIIATSVAINSFSIRGVAKVMAYLTLNAVAAFATLVAYAVHRGLDARRFEAGRLRERARALDWSECLNLLVYNSAGYDASAAVVSHVYKPRQTVPLAMAMVGCCIAALYVSALAFPYLATNDPASSWQSGHFVVVARELQGEWLATWIAVTCGLTNLQVYLSALMTASYTVQSMASQGVFPNARVWGARRRLGDAGTPVPAIALCALASALFSLAPLLVNLSLQAILYVFIMGAEIACFLRDNGEHAGNPSAPSARWGRQGALLVGKLWQRRAAVVAPVALSAWVLVVQRRAVAAPVIACIAAVAFWLLPREEERRVSLEEQVAEFYKQFDALGPEAKRVAFDAIDRGTPPALMPRSGGLVAMSGPTRPHRKYLAMSEGEAAVRQAIGERGYSLTL